LNLKKHIYCFEKLGIKEREMARLINISKVINYISFKDLKKYKEKDYFSYHALEKANYIIHIKI